MPTLDPIRLKEQKRAYYLRHREAVLRKSKAWGEANSEKKAASRRRSYLKNIDKARLRDRQRYLENREKILEQVSAWARKNKKRKATYMRAWLAQNQTVVKALRSERRARERNALGRHTAADIELLMQLQRGLCAVCRVPVRKSYHVDHIMPLRSGGSNERTNLQILCPSCNHQKHARHPVDFMQRKGFLL